jgi:hypothetical protein
VPSTIHPALASNTGTLRTNDDGSRDLYVGPTPPQRWASWTEIPGMSWFTIFRPYGHPQPWFDHTWRLDDIEPSDDT